LAPTTTTTTLFRYTYLRYDVDVNFCTTNNPQPFWSYTNYSAGYYFLNGTFDFYYYLSPSLHTSFTNQITSVSATSCAGTTTTTTTTAAPTTTTTTPAPTTTTTTTLPPIVVTGYNDCASYPSACDGAINITNITGGSGTGYQTRLNGGGWNNYPATNRYIGICGGSTNTLDARDSVGNFESSGPFNLCSNTTTTTTTTTTAAPVYYYNATRCFDGASKIVYGGGNYYGTGTVVISGGTTYCYTIQNETIPQAYDDTVGSSVGSCGDGACYVVPTTTTQAPTTTTTTAAPTTTTTTPAPTTTTTTAALCKYYDIVGYNADEYVDGIYTNCAGFPDTFSFYGGPGTVGSICARVSTVYITSGNGGATEGGTCS
jgi:hypothetical protein